MLQEVAARLRAVARESDTLARMGGGEFSDLLSTGTMPAGAVITAERIVNAMACPFVIKGHRFALGISIGISLYPSLGEDVAAMMRHAATAVILANRDNVGYSNFSGEDDGDSMNHLALTGNFRATIDQNEMAIHYQPKVNFKTGALRSAETLPQRESIQHSMV